MTYINQVWRTLSLQNKKFNSLNLVLLFTFASFIGTFGMLLPSLFSGTNGAASLDSSVGSNLGYEEMIRTHVDQHGNVTVIGSFHGPQATPAVDLSLPEYDLIWQLNLIATNTNTTDYYHKYMIQTLNQSIPKSDVYLNFLFYTEDGYMAVLDPTVPVLNLNDQRETAATLTADLEGAFGIPNNFSASPITVSEYRGFGRVIMYGFNYSAQTDYNTFVQYFSDNTPAGLADSFSSARITNTQSWLMWTYSTNWEFGEFMVSPYRSPYGDYNSSFECNAYLLYPQHFGAYSAGSYSLNLSEFLDTPFTPLVALNESAFSTSEIDFVIENGNVTSTTASPYHIPQSQGLDHDYWLLLNASFYDIYVFGEGSVSDIQCDFEYYVVDLNIIQPTAGLYNGTVNVWVHSDSNLTNYYGPILICQVFDAAEYNARWIDDNAQTAWYSQSDTDIVILMDLGGTGDYTGTWQNTYKRPNGDYVLDIWGAYTNFSGLVPRNRFGGNGGGTVYNSTTITLNNPGGIVVDVLNPQPNDAVVKIVNITANITGPELISLVDYYIYNYSGLLFGGIEIFNGTLINTGGSIWEGSLDTTQLQSTADYILRLEITDFNGTILLHDVPFTANNTFYQENVPIYAPMGAAPGGSGFELQIGTIEPPTMSDPYQGGSGGGGPTPHNFFGYGVDFGMGFKDYLYHDVWGAFFMADNNVTTNPLWQMIGTGIPDIDYGISIMMEDASPESIATCDEIAARAEVAFNLPRPLTYYGPFFLDMGGGGSTSDFVPFIIYADNYTTNNYGDIVDKFHASVPSGLADLYTKENMTQSDVNSTLFFGWINTEGLFGEMIYQSNPFLDYNCGEMAYISPTLTFPDYFDNTLNQPQTISLNTIFPQISQYNACSPGVASAVSSGFGPNMMGMPAGIIALNANITDWYPQSPFVSPLNGMIAPNYLNVISITMLETISTPFGVITTDEINISFSGPRITNNLLTPTEGQSITLLNHNITADFQCVTGAWNDTRWQLSSMDGSWGDGGQLTYTGSNWTDLLNSSKYEPGMYELYTYARSNDSMWAMNRTQIYINNSIGISTMVVAISPWGDLELIGLGSAIFQFFGYGINLGIDTTLEEYNSTEFQQLAICIAEDNTLNPYSQMLTGENWNMLIAFQGMDVSEQTSTPIIKDLERVFNITGMLQPVEMIAAPGVAWVMNYTPSRDYNDFLDQYESVRNTNLSNVFSKNNLLSADNSFLLYTIYSENYAKALLGGPYSENANAEEYVAVAPYMRFEDFYTYNTINQTETFSLANTFGLSEINTNYEQSMTYGASQIMMVLECGSIDNSTIYPYAPGYTMYMPGMFGNPDQVMMMMLDKNGPSQMGHYSTDDIRFNFTAPRTVVEVLSPAPGAEVHGDATFIVNATMSTPATNDVEAIVFPAGVGRNYIYSLFFPQDAIAEFTLTYDPTNSYWSGIWETLDTTIPNGWYDIVFEVTDNLSRTQYETVTVQVRNTYYQERLNVVVEQNGNISAGLEIQGHILDEMYNFSIPEYQDILMSNFIAVNAYSGHHNFTKDLYTDWLGFASFDYGLMVMVPQDLSDAEALALADPIKDDYERAFGIIGELTYLGSEEMGIQMGGPTAYTFRYVAYGNNYTATIKYEHFVDVFHQTTPDGLNNSVPLSTFTGTDSLIQWVTFFDPSFSPIRSIPNMDPYHSMIMTKLFYSQYFGLNYMQGNLNSHDLSISSLLGVPQIVFTSNDVADTMESSFEILVENANITSYYPTHEVIWVNNPNRLYGKPAERDSFSYSGIYNRRIYELGPFDDINVTFVEPMSRPLILSPTMGAIVDGVANVLVQVENSTPIADVYLKVYTVAEMDAMDQNRLLGPNPTMPNARPANFLYGKDSMNYLGGGLWNYSYPVHVFPDGPLWFEVEVETQNGLWSYNNTQVTVANTNPFRVNVLSPSDGANVSGILQLSTSVINGTYPVLGSAVMILDASGLTPISEVFLEPQGGDIYSTNFGTHQLTNGTYQLIFYAVDMSGIGTINATTIHVSNGEIIEVTFLNPTSILDWSPQANITVEVSSPYPVAMVSYQVVQMFYEPLYKMWQDLGTITTGVMMDPDSTWVAELDTTGWDQKVWNFMSNEWTDAYYEIQIVVSDLGEADGMSSYIYFSERFMLDPDPMGKPAVIIDPLEMTPISGIQTVTVQVTDFNDTIGTANGDVRRASDNTLVADLSFIISGTNATAQFYSYPLPDGYYIISAYGFAGGKSYTDSILVRVSNPDHHSVEIINPVEWDVLGGPVLIQLDIENNTALQEFRVEVSFPWSSSQLVQIQDWEFTYNSFSGYWEAWWNSTELVDGDYFMTAYIRDGNNFEDWDYIHFSTNNPPRVTILEPSPAANFSEYENIHFVVAVPDPDIDYIELWAEGNYIMNFTQSSGDNWTADWSDTIGYDGAVFIQVFAYDLGGQVNNTEWIGLSINKIIPPAGQADIYNATITNDNGTVQTTFVENDTVEYHATIRGDAGGTSYVVTAQTDDPFLSGYLEFNENVTVPPGVDFAIVFNYTIAVGAPTGTYTVQILIWTDWPWDGGICVDFITITFEVV